MIKQQPIEAIKKAIAEHGTPTRIFVGNEKILNTIKDAKEVKGVLLNVNPKKFETDNLLFVFKSGLTAEATVTLVKPEPEPEPEPTAEPEEEPEKNVIGEVEKPKQKRKKRK